MHYTPSRITALPALNSADDTLSAAFLYAEAGLYVLPVAAGSKNPGSVVGADWHTQSSRDTDQLAAWFAGTAHGIAIHCGRSGILALDIDQPDRVPADVLDAVAGAPFQSTSATDPHRGHYVFRVADGERYGNASGIPGADVRGDNGVIMVAPSRHPRSDGRYAWLRAGSLPMLPDTLRVHLSASQAAESAATDGEVARFLTEHVADERPGLLAAALDRFDQWTAEGRSRHDTMTSVAAQVTREAVAGCYPAQTAHDALRARFTAAMARRSHGERVLTRGQAIAEYDGAFAWAVAQAFQRDPAELRAEIDGRTLATLDTNRPATNLPAEFWDARPVLAHIRDAAHSVVLSADAAFHCTLARLSAMVAPTVRVDTGLGTASLNYFVALVGFSGAGKSAGLQVARELLPAPVTLTDFKDGVPPGSGEGVAELFMGEREQTESAGGRKRATVRAKVRDNALIYADEGQAVTRIGERSGATTMQALRSAWVGETLGQSNASKESTRYVPPGTYSLGLILAYQPDAIAELLADGGGGTPQRFAYCSAVDPSIPSHRVTSPGPITDLPIHKPWPDDLRTVVPIADDDIVAGIRADRLARQRGQGSALAPLDTHRPLHLAKTAALLAILDGRGEVNAEDYRLAGIVWETSCHVRDGLIADLADQQAEREEARTTAAAVREERLTLARSGAADKQRRVARLIADYVHEGKAATRGEARRRLRAADRGMADDAVNLAEAEGWIVADGPKGLCPGTQAPAS